MSNPEIQTKNLIVTSSSSFRIDFDITSGEENIKSIACGGAVDDYNYLMIYDLTGKSREFTFDFSQLKKTINFMTSSVNVVIKILDTDDRIFEYNVSKNYATDNGIPSISNLRISQRVDGSRLVDIEYDYQSPNEIDPATVLCLLSSNRGKTWDVPITSMTGDFGIKVPVGPNRKITWNPSVDLDISQSVPISAKISLFNVDGTAAVGLSETGTIVVSPVEEDIPIVSVFPIENNLSLKTIINSRGMVSINANKEKPQYAKPTGNLYKDNSIFFTALI